MSENKVPVHIAIIMDGNGRWAQKLGKPRSFGHREGLETAKKITLAASNAGIKYLSLYVFSTENWKRTETEVSFLMQLLKQHLRREYDFYKENQIRVIHSGDLERLPAEVKKEISSVTAETASFKGLTVNLAINYGGRDELIRAVNRWVNDSTLEKTALDEDNLRKYLDHPDVPDPDLVIRTAGEKRLSNFLLWETAYSELYFSEKNWPDWREEDLAFAIENYIKRDRKFGALSKENQ
ncbi:MAG: polyprenyl diphosphate synthase [Spirochaetia bacterium]|jgi:undecaprenyl diphosphate synthase|nr:polyprenyl diphosphate synthase [Spirochaetia bacterium]